MPEFESLFLALTGHRPFPWQIELYQQFLRNDLPDICSLPTGLGKTSIIPIWLIALAMGAKVPRRLGYVVNRRTVVDQTTLEVETIRKRLQEGKCPNVTEKLRSLCAIETAIPLGISTLRGEFADNQEWAADPARPAVICGTVDMIGSRLLFSGYRIGFRSRPLHAGFLGQDTLIVHDEAHLEPAFQSLLESIRNEQRLERQQGVENSWPSLHVMQLSATARQSPGGTNVNGSPQKSLFALTEQEKEPPQDISPAADGEPAIHHVWRRLKSRKELRLASLSDEKQLAETISKLALEHKNSNSTVLIYVRLIDDLKKVYDRLTNKKEGVPAERVIILTGTMRGQERNALVELPPFKRFLKNAPTGETVYLISTSAGEVGIDLSADHLVCDLSTYDSMSQRFGRVNRFGIRSDSRIDVVHPVAFGKVDKKTGELQADEIDKRRALTLELLEQLPAGENHLDASPWALQKLDPVRCQAAFAPIGQILRTTDILFDAWALTSIRKPMPGRPPVTNYLRGIREHEQPETQVAWRQEVQLIVGDLLRQHPPWELLEDFPLKPHELLSDRTDRVRKELLKLSERFPESPIWIVDEAGMGIGELKESILVEKLSAIAAKQTKDLDALLAGRTVLLPADIGGLNTQGILDGGGLRSESLDIADKWEGPDLETGELVQLRQRKIVSIVSDDLEEETQSGKKKHKKDRIPPGMKIIRRIKLYDDSPEAASEDEEESPKKTWCWYVRIQATGPDAKSTSPYSLERHHADAREVAERLVEKLPLPLEIRDVIVHVAGNHDLGKDREGWQSGIGNWNYPQEKWAKSGSIYGRVERSLYRHEFGSVRDIVDSAEFQRFSPDQQELALHLLAAHHGRARPHFTVEECLDETAGELKNEEQRQEVLRRFASLQRKYGRWGLAYLESLVRIADYEASMKASKGGNAQ